MKPSKIPRLSSVDVPPSAIGSRSSGAGPSAPAQAAEATDDPDHSPRAPPADFTTETGVKRYLDGTRMISGLPADQVTNRLYAVEPDREGHTRASTDARSLNLPDGFVPITDVMMYLWAPPGGPEIVFNLSTVSDHNTASAFFATVLGSIYRPVRVLCWMQGYHPAYRCGDICLTPWGTKPKAKRADASLISWLHTQQPSFQVVSGPHTVIIQLGSPFMPQRPATAPEPTFHPAFQAPATLLGEGFPLHRLLAPQGASAAAEDSDEVMSDSDASREHDRAAHTKQCVPKKGAEAEGSAEEDDLSDDVGWDSDGDLALEDCY